MATNSSSTAATSSVVSSPRTAPMRRGTVRKARTQEELYSSLRRAHGDGFTLLIRRAHRQALEQVRATRGLADTSILQMGYSTARKGGDATLREVRYPLARCTSALFFLSLFFSQCPLAREGRGQRARPDLERRKRIGRAKDTETSVVAPQHRPAHPTEVRSRVPSPRVEEQEGACVHEERPQPPEICEE